MKRSYQQFCGIAKALDVVGERWTLLIVRDLLLGGRRYSDLLEGLPGITTNLLATRLTEMQGSGLVTRKPLPPPARGVAYELTERGRSLEPALLALGAFGAKLMTAPAPGDRMNPRWAMVSLKRRYRGCPELWTIEMRVGDFVFALRTRPGPQALDVRDGPAHEPDVVLQGDLAGFRRWLLGGESLRALVDEGVFVREGPAKALAALSRAVGARP